mmetsp:Transcript_3228/g.7025  ORF Transcript_3228/g.7025 Transcript_3228/m.7025 type:complete len:93 (-) Transcript_3228:40-318(-)
MEQQSECRQLCTLDGIDDMGISKQSVGESQVDLTSFEPFLLGAHIPQRMFSRFLVVERGMMGGVFLMSFCDCIDGAIITNTLLALDGHTAAI